MVLSPLATWGTSALCASAVIALARRRGTDRRLVIVDAGSGSTRCVCLGSRRSDGEVRVVAGPERVPLRLGDALLSGAAADVDAWAGAVTRACDGLAGPRVPVYVRGTAGARDALRRRGEKDLGATSRDVEGVLRGMRRGPGGVSFVVLDGDAEARLELGAVRHYRPTQGLFAGGGKSIQVGSGFGDARSFAIDSFAGHDLVKKHGAIAGAKMHEWAVRRVVANDLVKADFKRLDGTFATIELVSNTLERAAAQRGETLEAAVTRDAAIDLVSGYRAALEKKLNPNPNVADRGLPLVDGDSVKQLVYCAQILPLLELVFESTAAFEVLPFKGTPKTPTTNWALGLYLDQRSSGL